MAGLICRAILEDRVRVLFMKDKIGEEYEGIITHITSYGIFVEPFDVFVEGFALLILP